MVNGWGLFSERTYLFLLFRRYWFFLFWEPKFSVVTWSWEAFTGFGEKRSLFLQAILELAQLLVLLHSWKRCLCIFSSFWKLSKSKIILTFNNFNSSLIISSNNTNIFICSDRAKLRTTWYAFTFLNFKDPAMSLTKMKACTCNQIKRPSRGWAKRKEMLIVSEISLYSSKSIYWLLDALTLLWN